MQPNSVLPTLEAAAAEYQRNVDRWRMGDPDAMRWCAVAMVDGRIVKRDVVYGVSILVRLAGTGCLGAMVDLGSLHYVGWIDGAPNMDAAQGWYRKAAEAGAIEGMTRLVAALLADPRTINDADRRAEVAGWSLRLIQEDGAMANAVRAEVRNMNLDLEPDDWSAGAVRYGARTLN